MESVRVMMPSDTVRAMMSDSTAAVNKNYGLRHLFLASRDKQVYFAKLAEQAERYDEMADHMESVIKLGYELTVEERNLLSVAYKNAVGKRLVAWRIIARTEQREKSQGNAAWAREYCTKVEGELQKICGVILGLLDQSLIPKASNDESKVFYQKMKAEYLHYMEEMGRAVYWRCRAAAVDMAANCVVCKPDGMDQDQSKYLIPYGRNSGEASGDKDTGKDSGKASGDEDWSGGGENWTSGGLAWLGDKNWTSGGKGLAARTGRAAARSGGGKNWTSGGKHSGKGDKNWTSGGKGLASDGEDSGEASGGKDAGKNSDTARLEAAFGQAALQDDSLWSSLGNLNYHVFTRPAAFRHAGEASGDRDSEECEEEGLIWPRKADEAKKAEVTGGGKDSGKGLAGDGKDAVEGRPAASVDARGAAGTPAKAELAGEATQRRPRSPEGPTPRSSNNPRVAWRRCLCDGTGGSGGTCRHGCHELRPGIWTIRCRFCLPPRPGQRCRCHCSGCATDSEDSDAGEAAGGSGTGYRWAIKERKEEVDEWRS